MTAIGPGGERRWRRTAARAGWRAGRVLGVAAVFGLAGLLVLFIVERRARGWRLRSVGRATVGVGVVLLVAGALSHAASEVMSIDRCPPPPGQEETAEREAAEQAIAITPFERVMTWSPTGLAMLYSAIAGGDVCHFVAQEYYVSIFDRWPLSRAGVFVGNIFMSRRFEDEDVKEILDLSGHEVVHREQWAIGTLLGGPLGFPAAYTIDGLFFPAGANHFEQAAGLDAGGYDGSTAPRFTFKELAAIAVAVVLIETTAFGFRRSRRTPAREPLAGETGGP